LPADISRIISKMRIIENKGERIGPTKLDPGTYLTRDVKDKFTSGNFAVVVPAERDDGSKVALRFFLGKVPSHTTQIISHIMNYPHPGLVGCKILRKLLSLKDGTEVDAMEMDYIDGKNLDDEVDSYLKAGRASDLTVVADNIFQNVMGLLKTGFLHGDLSHGNVMIETATGAVRFVDYDSAVINSMDSKNLIGTLEEGHPNYHHPSRRGRELLVCDVLFSALVIHVSLVSLARDPSLWTKFNKDVDGLLFRSANDDLQSTDTDLWRSIRPLFPPNDKNSAPFTILENCVGTKDLTNSGIEAKLKSWWPSSTVGPVPSSPSTVRPVPSSPSPVEKKIVPPSPSPIEERIVPPSPSPMPRPIVDRPKPKPSPMPKAGQQRKTPRKSPRSRPRTKRELEEAERKAKAEAVRKAGEDLE